VYAIGERTSRVLAAEGIEAQVPESASSEGLMALLDGVDAGLKVLVVAGEDGRKDLTRFLAGQGAEVSEYLCYRRAPANPAVQDLAGVNTVLVASQDGFRHVARLWFENGGSPTVRVLAASARIAMLGAELGFLNVVTTRGAATEDWLTALEDDKDDNGG
jgi:uroporphyrinogen-III synthase